MGADIPRASLSVKLLSMLSNRVTWIPIIEYSLVAVIAGLVWIGLKIADAVRSRSGSDSPDLRSPTTAGHRA